MAVVMPPVVMKARIPGLPTTEEYRRAVAIPVASVETLIVVGESFAKRATPEAIIKSTGMPGFVICSPFWSYIFAVIVEGVRLSAGTDGGAADSTMLAAWLGPVKST
jgi:hypothetical protein